MRDDKVMLLLGISRNARRIVRPPLVTQMNRGLPFPLSKGLAMRLLLFLGLLFIQAFFVASSFGGELIALRGRGWLGFVIVDKDLSKRLSKQDLFLLGLSLRQKVFDTLDPLSGAREHMPVVVQDSSATHALELDQAIERLGRLIQVMKQRKSEGVRSRPKQNR